LRFELPPRGTLSPNSAVDPLRYYYTPVVGKIFTSRLQIGLDLIDTPFERLLEIGYGSGLLMPSLARITGEIWGADLLPEPAGLRDTLARLGVQPRELVQADIRELPFADGFFDGVVAFSILEHLKQAELTLALAELARVLSPEGRLLIGLPAVHPVMNAAFAAIGFANIGDHHFSGLPEVLSAADAHFTVERRASLPRLMRFAPAGWAPYSAVLFRRK
jgi:2-polyprenyl-3-methyl-5-hydroxy-6-metoxy-1,4-benzoquinol methylase